MSQPEPPRVLIVEDDVSFHTIWRMILEPHAKLVFVVSRYAARKELKANPNFSHVILDGCVPAFDNEPLRPHDTTIDLAHEVAEFYPIPMYAASSSSELNRQLALAGCLPTDKNTAVYAVRDALLAAKQ